MNKIAISAHTVYFPIPYPKPVPNPQIPLKTALTAAIVVLIGAIFHSEPENSRIFSYTRYVMACFAEGGQKSRNGSKEVKSGQIG